MNQATGISSTDTSSDSATASRAELSCPPQISYS